MSFNLLNLHDFDEDKNVKELLRVYSVLPRFSKISTEQKAEQAVRVVKFLREVNEKLKKKIAPNWKEKWMKLIEYPFSVTSCKDWFFGRASIPLIALKRLNNYGLESDIKELIDTCTYFSSSRYRPFTIPHEMNEDLAYLTAAILCDGHLAKYCSKISYELNDRLLVEKFSKKVEDLFQQKLTIQVRLNRDKPRYSLGFTNKSAFRLFNKFLEIPRGKKSDIIIVPIAIQQSGLNIKKAFLEGVFDTDGGKRNNGLGLTSASKEFRDQLIELLKEFNIHANKDEWLNKIYNKWYYGLRFKIDSNSMFLRRDIIAGVR